MRIVYNKLIRGRIPEIIANTGKACVVTPMHQEEYLKALKEKLVLRGSRGKLSETN